MKNGADPTCFPALSRVEQIQIDFLRIVISRSGREVAAVISVDDLALLRQLEDARDIAEAKAAQAEAKRDGTVSWKKLKGELRLGR